MTTPRAIVENLPGSNEKYECDETGGVAKEFDLPDGMNWPCYYGSILGTRAPDGDPLDVFIISNKHYARGEVVEVRVADQLIFIDRGDEDPKIIAISADETPSSDTFLQETYITIATFLKKYKEAKGHAYSMGGFTGSGKAEETIAVCERAWERER